MTTSSLSISAGTAKRESTVVQFTLNIKEQKIWIQRDFTEAGIAQQLVERGVPKADVVLSFRSPFVRQFSEFAIA